MQTKKSLPRQIRLDHNLDEQINWLKNNEKKARNSAFNHAHTASNDIIRLEYVFSQVSLRLILSLTFLTGAKTLIPSHIQIANTTIIFWQRLGLKFSIMRIQREGPAKLAPSHLLAR